VGSLEWGVGSLKFGESEMGVWSGEVGESENKRIRDSNLKK